MINNSNPRMKSMREKTFKAVDIYDTKVTLDRVP